MGAKRLSTSKLQKASQRINQVPHLPPELCDMVIDFLHDNKVALASCSLVCRSWSRAARYHLFDSIYELHRHTNQSPSSAWAQLPNIVLQPNSMGKGDAPINVNPT